MAARWAGSFGVSSRFGCPHHCCKTIHKKNLANALFSASRFSEVELHFNKGLAGAPSEAIEAAKDTAMNPAVCDAFALAIIADGQGPAYPGIAITNPTLPRAAGLRRPCIAP